VRARIRSTKPGAPEPRAAAHVQYECRGEGHPTPRGPAGRVLGDAEIPDETPDPGEDQGRRDSAPLPADRTVPGSPHDHDRPEAEENESSPSPVVDGRCVVTAGRPPASPRPPSLSLLVSACVRRTVKRSRPPTTLIGPRPAPGHWEVSDRHGAHFGRDPVRNLPMTLPTRRPAPGGVTDATPPPAARAVPPVASPGAPVSRCPGPTPVWSGGRRRRPA
jgi:hypothetical protein